MHKADPSTGRTLLTPGDPFDPIRELNEQCDGALAEAEQLRPEYTALAAAAGARPLKRFSGCACPRPDPDLIEAEPGQLRWSDRAGFTVWRCYDLAGDRVLTAPGAIAALIRSQPDTRQCGALDRAALSELRQRVEKQVVTEYLRPLQAPVGVTPILKWWMALNEANYSERPGSQFRRSRSCWG